MRFSFIMGGCSLAWLVSGLAMPGAQAQTKFQHVIIVIQENRTPDNLFGSNPNFEPGVDIATSGVNSHGTTVPLTAVALANCYDISHSHDAFEAMLTKGADKEITKANHGCKLPNNPQFKYVDNSSGTVQPYFDIATNYGFANRMFQTNQGPSFPAHQFLFGATSAPIADTSLFAAENMSSHGAGAGCVAPAGQRVRLIDQNGSEQTQKPVYPCLEHPTLSDNLEAATPGLGWRYYTTTADSIWTAPSAIKHICNPSTGSKPSCVGADWLDHVVLHDPALVLTDIGSCQLQAVSWVTPTPAESDHAAVNSGLGPAWVASIINAVGKQTCGSESYWQDTAIVVLWDDWGGWYDHVSPFDIVKAPAWGSGYAFGFRVPLLVVSAYTSPGYVSNNIMDFGNIVYFVEQNFGLGFIGPGGDAHGEYADYYASPRGALQDFFSLKTPRPFTPIPARQGAEVFLNQPAAQTGPDDDD
jgi:phospholipase C